MRFTLFGKLNAAIVTTFLIISMIAGAIMVPLHFQRMQRSKRMVTKLLEMLVSRDSSRLANELFERRTRALQIHIREMAALNNILSVTVFDASKQPVAHLDRFQGTVDPPGLGSSLENPGTIEWNAITALVYEAPVTAVDEHIGHIQILYSLAETQQENRLSMLCHMALLVAALILTMLLLNRIQSSFVVKPIKRLIRGMEQLQEQTAGNAIPKISNDEIGDLTLAFNRMKKDLSSAIETLKQEVKERREAERLLKLNQAATRESEALFRSVFHLLPDAININRLSDGRCVDVNQGFVRLSGFTREEVLGKTTLEIGLWENLEDRAPLITTLQEKGRTDNVELKFRKKNGELRTSLISSALINLNNEPHIVSVTHDIENRKRMEQALRESEERFRLAFEHAMVGRIIALPEGRFVQVNPSFAAIVGWTEDKLLSMNLQEVIHPEFRSMVKKFFSDLLDNRTPSTLMELKLLHKEGIPVWARANAILARNEQGEPRYLIADIEDITVYRSDQEQLRKYERIFETSPDLISLVDRQYRFEAVNSSYLRIHNRDLADVIGHTISHVIGEKIFLDVIKEKLDQAFTGKVIRYQHEFGYLAQGKRYMDVAYYPFMDDKGDITGVVTHQKDITENRVMEQRLIQSQKMEAIGTLAGGIAHDFNNILSGIFGYSQLTMIHIKETQKARAHLEQVLKGAQRATELVQQILTFSRQSDHTKRPLGLYLVIKEALKLLRPSLPSTITIRERIQSKATVMADPTRMHQVIMNLCTNAYHAMAVSGGILTVEVRDARVAEGSLTDGLYLPPGDYIQLAVTDTGHGMDRETLGKVFDPYFTTKEVGRGTGLGLALVHGIVQEHGGQVKAHSTPGKGSSFHVYLPVIHKSAAEVEPRHSMHTSVGGNENIMVVDDEETIRMLTRDFLEDIGYTVHLFSNGASAWKAFEDSPQRFDLVVTDMTMPVMTGDDLAANILALRPEIPVILCSGYSEKMNNARAEGMGIRHFIQKPVDPHHLAALIRGELNTGS